MAIEFRCPQCQRLLRVEDEAAGKQAKCPECGAVSVIPPSGAQSAGGSAPPPLPPQQTAEHVAPGDAGRPFATAELPSGLTPTPIDLNDIFSTTWEIFTAQLAACVLAGLIPSLVLAGAGFVLWIFLAAVSAIRSDALMMLCAWSGGIAMLVLSFCVQIGLYRVFLRIARGQAFTFNEFFPPGPVFLRWLAVSFLLSLIVSVGHALCIVPGIFLALLFSQSQWLVLDRNVGVFDSFGLSMEITRGSKLTLLLVWLLAGLAALGVVLFTCGLGYLVTVPFLTLMAAVIYLRMTGQPIAANPRLR